MSSLADILKRDSLALLTSLIELPSFSKEEQHTAKLIAEFFQARNVAVEIIGNNVIARNRHFDTAKPTLLLNSHHDTVKPVTGYTRNPFEATLQDGKIFGLGSNDAGGCLVALIAAFLYFFERPDLPVNIVLAATAEEEISGQGGIELALTALPSIDCAIVGEPTMMQMAIAERGLMVLDCVARGRAGHAARNEGENAIYSAIQDIEWFKTFEFPKHSNLLGASKMTVTVINTDNTAHNIVPSQCSFVVDARINELYSFEEALDIIRQHVACEVTPRSTRLRSSIIPREHPLVQSGLALRRNCYGSPTTSDKALMPFDALKMGPGDSARSHTADEFIYVHEVEQGIDLYIALLDGAMSNIKHAARSKNPSL